MRPYNNSSSRSRRAAATQLGGRHNYEEEEALGETNPAFRGVLGVFTPSIVTLPSLSSSYWLLTHCPS